MFSFQTHKSAEGKREVKNMMQVELPPHERK
jgi:hypothetical protein